MRIIFGWFIEVKFQTRNQLEFGQLFLRILVKVIAVQWKIGPKKKREIEILDCISNWAGRSKKSQYEREYMVETFSQGIYSATTTAGLARGTTKKEAFPVWNEVSMCVDSVNWFDLIFLEGKDKKVFKRPSKLQRFSDRGFLSTIEKKSASLFYIAITKIFLLSME